MATLLTRGRLVPCKDNISGLKEFYTFNRIGTKVTLNNDKEVININKTSGSPLYLSKYVIKGQSKYTENKQEMNKLVYYDQNLNVYFKGVDTETNNLLYQLACERDISIIAVQNNYKPILIGKNAGLFIDSANQVIDNDLYGYNFTFSGKEPNQANYISGYTEANPFAFFTDQPIITGTIPIYLDGNFIECFLSYSAQTYSGITLGIGDEFISDDNFYNIDGFLWIGECVLNEDEFIIDYYETGEADLYFMG